MSWQSRQQQSSSSQGNKYYSSRMNKGSRDPDVDMETDESRDPPGRGRSGQSAHGGPPRHEPPQHPSHGRAPPSQSHQAWRPHDDRYSAHGGQPRYEQESPSFVQTQQQRHRSLQASEQMLYDVYEHTVGMIEELEKHEDHGKQAPENSGLLSYIFPSNYKKPKHDVTAVIEAELVCLRSQLKHAPPEVTEKSRGRMIRRILMWEAAREENGVPPSHVDQYAKNVVQILTEGSMELPPREKGPHTELTQEVAQQVLMGYGQARHKGDLQDQQFHDDPNKQAVLRAMRQGSHDFMGARRLVKLKPGDRKFIESLERNGYDVHDFR